MSNEQVLETEELSCPFCGDSGCGGYDKPGLKAHITNGWCDIFNKTENV